MPGKQHLLDAVIYVIRGMENQQATVAQIVADIILKDIYRKSDGTFPTTAEVTHLVYSRADIFRMHNYSVTYIGPKFPF